MPTDSKQIAYLAPELPSLSATFVTNEIWGLEKLGITIQPYSVHKPHNKAHGERAEELAARTAIVYDKSALTNFKALLWNTLNYKRSTLKAFGQLIGDLFRTGLVSVDSFKLGYQFFRSAWLAVDMREKKISHLHIHFAHVPTQIAMYACALADVPFSYQTHANDIFERPLLIKEKIRRAKRAVSISDFNIDLMEKKGGNRRNVEIVRCGVDSSLPMKKSGEVISETPVIGTLGRLVEKKGVDTLIEAGRMLAEQGVPFRIEIAGDGPLIDELQALVHQSGLSEKVSFIGAMPHSEALVWIGGLDIFVLAGKKDRNGDMDGIPVVLMEAMNFGVPVVSTRLSGIPELVVHEKTGLIGEPENAEDLAQNLERMVKDAELRKKLVSGAKEIIASEFDLELNARRLLKIFSE